MAAIPPSLLVTDFAYALDGGSIHLEFLGPDNTKHKLLMPQHAIPENFTPGEPPGALIFDGELLPVRGEDEAALLEALRGATYAEPDSAGRDGEGIAPGDPGAVIGDDLKDLLAAIDKGPCAAMKLGVDWVISFVKSSEYVEMAKCHGRLA